MLHISNICVHYIIVFSNQYFNKSQLPMEKNKILARTLLEAFPDISASDPIIEIIKQEIEDDELMDSLKLINAAPLAYYPYSVELLINEASELIQSCIQKRNELKNLEVTLLTEAINRILDRQRKVYEDQVVEAEIGFTNSSKMLSKQTKVKYTNVWQEADPASAQEIKVFEDAIKKARRELKSEYEKYDDLTNEFAKDINSGLNFLYRYKETKEIYWEDFQELFRKLKSLEVGFKTVYEINSPLPTISKENFLNRCYIWLKQNLLKVSKILEKEQEFTLVFPLKVGVFEKDGATAIGAVADFDNKRNIGLIEFKIPKSLLQGKKLVRIRHIGLSLRIDARTNDIEHWNVKVYVPKQTDSQNTEWSIPELCITATNGREILPENQVRSLAYFNVNPFIENDDWKIRLPVKSSKEQARSTINDVIISLKLAVIG